MRGVFCVLVLFNVLLAHAQDTNVVDVLDRTQSFSIGPGALEIAILEFSKQAQVAVSIDGGLARRYRTSGVQGYESARTALTKMLAGTGLTVRIVRETVQIVESVETGDTTVPSAEHEGQMRAPRAAGPSGEGSQQVGGLMEEIVVSAQKRGKERLQDVPIPVSVLSPISLLENGTSGLQNYFSKVAGVSLVSGVGGTNTVIIRGVATNGLNDNPTIGVTVDDAPYSPSTFLGGGLQPIDMDPNELAQIEVLRGPQGTLYGASSLGGLLRYVMVDPSLDGFSGRVMIIAQDVSNSDGFDHSLRGSINLPINSKLGLRVSGFNRREAGYIDDTFSGRHGVNAGHAYGGRAALLWRVSDDWSLKLSAIRQNIRTDAANIVDIDPSEDERLQSTDYIPGSGGADRSVSLFTGTIQGAISNVDVTSISAYTRSRSMMREGFTRGLFRSLSQLADPSADVGLLLDTQPVSKFSQELRANISLRDNIDWLVGAFYTREKGEFIESISSGLRDTGERTSDVGNVFNGYGETWINYNEIAAFTNLFVRFTDRFDVQFGGRFSEIRQKLSQFTDVSFLTPNGPTFDGPIRSTDTPFTYLITPRFRLTDSWMVYSRIASGYRPGGPSFNRTLPGAPQSLKADTTENYEVGIKGDVFDHLLSIDASAYYIDWKDIPVLIQPRNSVLTYLDNAGGAISKGLEVSFSLRPLPGLTLSAWGAWSDAYIDKLPANASPGFDVGSRLPFSPRFAGNASIDYEHPLSETMSGNMGIAVSYVGDRAWLIGSPEDVLTSYAQADAYVGLKSGRWTVNAFVNNVTDERGRIGPKVLDGIQGQPPPVSVLVIRPRTMGLSIAKDF